MDLRIPSQVLAATFELALLTWNISPTEASPVERQHPTILDPSPLPSLSPKRSDQSQHTLSESLPSYPISNSRSASNTNSNTNTNTKTKSKSKSKFQSISYSYFNFDSSDDDSDTESTSSFEFDDFKSDYPSFTNPFSTSSKQCTYNSNPTPQPPSQRSSSNILTCTSDFETDRWEGSQNCEEQSLCKERNEFWFPSSSSQSYSPPISPLSTPSSGSFFSDMDDDDDENGEEEDHEGDKEEVVEVTSGSAIRLGAKECCRVCESCLYNAVLDGAIKMECRVSKGVIDDGQVMLDWL